ncbi:hypothetical protein [Chromobacterium haemolyticum]|uniref:hypothetical protein n=1 Tax=Chromobacterium haemolyticum TaxID=394935 RepID=UPI0013B43F98|nr:hypothetical protein [Chromobacterium haemolyticum]
MKFSDMDFHFYQNRIKLCRMTLRFCSISPLGAAKAKLHLNQSNSAAKNGFRLG